MTENTAFPPHRAYFALAVFLISCTHTYARGTENVVPHILECARSYCTLYEIRAALEDVFGAYREPVFF